MTISRFAADLPRVDQFVTLGEGDTPVVELPAIAGRLGLRRLSAKLETQNPTGSYKDRVAAMSLSLARQQRKRGWIASSSGNAGLAMAAYGTRSGLPGFLCLVATAPLEKSIPLQPYAVAVIGVDGVGDGATSRELTGLMDEIRDAAERHGLYLGITAHAMNHDGMRGVDTIGYELTEQVPTASHVFVPAGGGGLLVALARGLRQREHDAHVVACQPSGCAPVVRFLDGGVPIPVIAHCDSLVSGLQVPSPPDGPMAVEAVERSQGWGTMTSDDEILAAQRLLATVEGIFVEPAAATTLAALVRDVESGRVDRHAHPVLILSGAGWKDLGRFGAAAGKLPIVTFSDVAPQVDMWATGLDSSDRHLAGRHQ
ncbi:pyridoxal-phosphate dependent enzyme [Jiangella muralis]|uniref:pyridoxal-phosphate dependent enzyme n=1 Tax=Jiangella muralis TaxID=702383 RepID=UPI00069F1B48|nr:pyridoxal-phosphate dependent enzyme [Jiangella muralis]